MNKKEDIKNKININNLKEQKNNKNLSNKYIDNIYISFAPDLENNNKKEKNEDKEIKDLVDELNEKNEKKNKKDGIYKSNDLERIIKENKNKNSIKKPTSDINTIFNYIENEYNVDEEENNNTNCDRSFSFRQKFTGNFGQEEKNINNEKDKEGEKDIKFSFKINSELNESEFSDINYF